LTAESHCTALIDVNNDGRQEAVVCDQYQGPWSGVAVLNSSTGRPIVIPSRNNTISWTSGGDNDSGDTLTYDVYFGTANPPTTKVSGNQSTTTCNIGSLWYNTRYYWRINTWDSHGNKKTGTSTHNHCHH
jgi:hypothetical protein